MNPLDFQVTIKALIFDGQGHVLLIQESDGVWELPGGRMEHGEDFFQALNRECIEELGVAGVVLDNMPYLAWSARHSDGLWKIVLCFRVVLSLADLARYWKKCDECVAYQFYDFTSKPTLNLAQQLLPLYDHLAKKLESP